MTTRAMTVGLLLSLASVVSLNAACAGAGQPIDTGTPSGDDDDDGTIDTTFSGGVIPSLEAEDCGSAACHSNANSTVSGNLILPGSAATLTTAQAFSEITTGGNSGSAVNTADPPNSLLLTKALGVGHTGGAVWTDSDDTYESVLGWITAGAPND